MEAGDRTTIASTSHKPVLDSAASKISADENSTDRWRHPHAADKINRNIRPSRNDNQLVLIIQCGHVHTSPNSARLHADRASRLPDRPTDCPPSLPSRRSTGRPGALNGRPVAHRPGYHQHHRLRRDLHVYRSMHRQADISLFHLPIIRTFRKLFNLIDV